MSMLGNAGAQAAAQDIIDFIEKLEREEMKLGQQDPVAFSLLGRVKKHAQDIVKACQTGWY